MLYVNSNVTWYPDIQSRAMSLSHQDCHKINFSRLTVEEDSAEEDKSMTTSLEYDNTFWVLCIKIESYNVSRTTVFFLIKGVM